MTRPTYERASKVAESRFPGFLFSYLCNHRMCGRSPSQCPANLSWLNSLVGLRVLFRWISCFLIFSGVALPLFDVFIVGVQLVAFVDVAFFCLVSIWFLVALFLGGIFKFLLFYNEVPFLKFPLNRYTLWRHCAHRCCNTFPFCRQDIRRYTPTFKWNWFSIQSRYQLF